MDLSMDDLKVTLSDMIDDYNEARREDKERRRARNRNLEKYGVEVLTPDGVTPEQASSQNSHSYDEQQQYSDGYFEAQHRYSSGNGMQPGAYGEYDVQNLTSYNTNGQQPGTPGLQLPSPKQGGVNYGAY